MTRLLTLTAVLVLAVASAQARQQVLENGSFENLDPNNPDAYAPDPNDPNDGVARWNIWSGAATTGPSTAAAVDGERCFAIFEADSIGSFQGNSQGAAPNMQASPGDVILMRCMAMHFSGNPVTGLADGLGGQPIAGIKMQFPAPSGVDPAPPVEDLAFPKNDPNDPFDDDPNDVWVLKTLVVEVPEDVAAARIVLINFDSDPNTNDNGPCYMDNVVAELASAPGANQLTNGSFENGTDAPEGIDDWDEFFSDASGARFNAFEVPAQEGFAVVKFTGTTSGLTQEFAVTTGDTITLTGYFRSDGADPFIAVDEQAGLKVEWLQATDTPGQVDIRDNDNEDHVWDGLNLLTSASPTDVWVPLTIEFNMPLNKAAGIQAVCIAGWYNLDPFDVVFDGYETVFPDRFDGSDQDADNDADMNEVAAVQKATGKTNADPIYPFLVFDHDDSDTIEAADALFTIERVTGPN